MVMQKTLTLILGVALFGILAAVVVASQGADDPARTGTVSDTVERTTTTEDNPTRTTDDDGAQGGVDISGPCDEAEHANDPRCTGAAPSRGGDNDNSGPGSSHSGRGGGDDDNSGPGGGDDND